MNIPPTERVDIKKLKTDGQNPNRMSEAQHEALKKSIEKFGFLIPIITNEDYLIADGEQRYEVAKAAGWTTVPVVRLPIKDVDRRILRQVLNKLKGSHEEDLDIAEFQKIVDAGQLTDLSELLAEDPTDFLRLLDENKEITTEEVRPFLRTHILLSFPPEKLSELSKHIEKIKSIEGVEYEQGSN
jgi:ParB-like chromosome segregation protein Spo0J